MAFWIAMTPLLHRVLSLPRLLRLLAPNGASGEIQKPGEGSEEDLDHFHRFIQALFRPGIAPFKHNCFVQSLVLFRVLRRHGVPVRILFGLREAGDQVDGHAWLELDGVALWEKANPREAFVVSYSAGGESDMMPTDES